MAAGGDECELAVRETLRCRPRLMWRKDSVPHAPDDQGWQRHAWQLVQQYLSLPAEIQDASQRGERGLQEARHAEHTNRAGKQALCQGR